MDVYILDIVILAISRRSTIIKYYLPRNNPTFERLSSGHLLNLILLRLASETSIIISAYIVVTYYLSPYALSIPLNPRL